MCQGEVEKLKRRINLMEGRSFRRIADFAEYLNEARQSPYPIQEWAYGVEWPIRIDCKICNNGFDVSLNDLDDCYFEFENKLISSGPLGHLSAIIKCKNCQLEDPYLLANWGL